MEDPEAIEEIVNSSAQSMLEQNYPNPFITDTTISYTLPSNMLVSLKVYNILGEEVSELLHESRAAGKHSVVFNTQSLPGGIYLYTLRTKELSLTRYMHLVH